jgi:hypothetical protein
MLVGLLIMNAPNDAFSRSVVLVACALPVLAVVAVFPALERWRKYELVRLLDSDGYRRLQAIGILTGVGDVCRHHALDAVAGLTYRETAGKNAAGIAMCALSRVKSWQNRKQRTRSPD